MTLYKKIKYGFFAALMLVLLGACSKDFLEKQPIGRISKNLLLEDPDGLKIALNGSYNRVVYYYVREFGAYGDVAGGDLLRFEKAGSGTFPLRSEYNFQSARDEDAATVGHIWLNIFEALNNVNNVINAIPTVKEKYPSQARQLDSLSAQALVLRAMCHFDLAKAYAQSYNYTSDASHLGVPVLTKTPSPGVPVVRKSMKETYDVITADLLAALPLLKKYYNNNRAVVSYQAAWAFLSRLNLYRDNWDETINWSDSIIQKGGFTLTPHDKYAEMFYTIKPSNETIWQLIAIEPGMVNTIFSDTTSFNYYPSKALTSLYDAADIRLSSAYFPFPTHSPHKDKMVTTKYGYIKPVEKTPFSIQLYRLSEIYLNRAEALWHKGRYDDAAADLKLIVQRAHPNTTVEITYTSPADLFKQISDERRRELAFEGHRLFDIARRHESIVRVGDCADPSTCTFTLTYPNNRFVLPIPGKELDANRAMQPNPGIND